MRTKVTLVLVLLNVVLFFYISKFEIGIPDKHLGNSVYGSEVAAIETFARKDRTGIPLMMEKDKKGIWWLTKPYEWLANPNAISAIVSELQHLNHEISYPVTELAKNGLPLANYGLDNPALTFTFTSGGKSYETKVGDTTKTNNRLYLLSPDGSRIHVVNSSMLDQIDMSLDRLRSPTIFSIPIFEVRSLSIQTSTTSKVRLRREGETWNLEAPIQTRADKNMVNTTINALNSLQALKFLETREAADLTLTGLANPTVRVTLGGNNRWETLLIGRPVPESEQPLRSDFPSTARPTIYYAKFEDKPSVFTTALPNTKFDASSPTSPTLLDSLLGAQKILRDKHILDFDPRTVTAISLAAPGQPEINLHRLEAAASTEAWQLIARNGSGQAPQTQPADVGLVAELLRKLGLLLSKEFLSDAPSAADRENYGFNQPERTVTLNLNTGGGPHLTDPSTVTLHIGVKPEERNVAYAMLSNSTFVYEVDPSILEYTPVDSRQFRQRLLRELPEGTHITALTLTESGNATPLYTQQLTEGETWEKALAAEPAARQKAVNALLTQLRAIRAQRFITESFNPDHAESAGTTRPWKYQLSATITLPGGNGATQTSDTVLQLTERTDSLTQLAGSADFGVTFTLPQEMIDALFALTYGEKHDPGEPAKTEIPVGK